MASLSGGITGVSLSRSSSRRWRMGGPKSNLDAVAALMAHEAWVPRGGVLGPRAPAASRGTYPTRRTCVATLLGGGARTGGGGGRGPRSTPRCPPAPPVVRWRPATRRPRYVRGYCVEPKRYYELVYLVRYLRYRYLAAQRGRAALVKARGPVARVSSERRSVSARSPLHRARD